MTPNQPPKVCIFLTELLGGVVTMMSRWAESSANRAETSIVLLRDTAKEFTPLGNLSSKRVGRLIFDGTLDNRYLLYERMARAIPDEATHIVANDMVELGMISTLGLPNPLAFVLHGDSPFYYDLATRHAQQIGSFLCVSQRIHRTLCTLLPDKRAEIHLTYPIVPQPKGNRTEQPADKTLRLLFVGRLTEEKGFFDLPLIDAAIEAANVAARWTVMAPEVKNLGREESEWLSSTRVTHVPFVPNDQMESIYLRHDILVFPSRGEGFGMAILEGMACGVIPIATRLDAGVPEMIQDGTTGFLVGVKDIPGIAARIHELWRDPDLALAMRTAARRSSHERFDSAVAIDNITRAVLAAQPRRKSATRTYLSRLDRPWLPNSIVRFSRRISQARSRARGAR